MSHADELVWMIGQMGAAMAPALRDFSRFGPAIERAYWPKGAPRVVTWALLEERLVARLRVKADEKIERELARATGGRPRQGAPLPKATASLIVETEAALKRVAGAGGPNVVDTVLFSRVRQDAGEADLSRAVIAPVPPRRDGGRVDRSTYWS